MNKIILIGLLLFSSISMAELKKPKTVSEFKETSVRILNLQRSSGGSGSIFRSFSTGSHILTNKHVCRIIEQGGVVDSNGKMYLITHYKKFDQHDLCIVRINENLNIDLEISDTLAKPSSRTVVSGHPGLLPHIASSGHLSENEEIELMIGMKPCTKENFNEDPLACIFIGGIPIFKKFDSQVISNLIQPGSSGSAVFNSDGEIVGLVFAGSRGGFSYGFIVPQIYVLYFIQNAHRFDWVKVGTKVDDKGLEGRTFNFGKCEDFNFKMKFENICKYDNLIGRK